MNKINGLLSKLLMVSSLMLSSQIYAAEDTLGPKTMPPPPPSPADKPLITPTPPTVNAKSYILIDVNSGKIIAEKNADERLPPASLTKMMTLYVISNALHNNQIHLEDKVRVSHDAWKTGGSRMFITEGEMVSIEDLLKGIIVDSGNDACVAMAEHLGGSERGFSDIMNQQSQSLGMANSHFTDSTGLPDPDHFTTAKDLAILGRALVNDFPEYYHWYKQKWFTYNNIKQPNRNRLLWRDTGVDGLKTGHTNEAGFCLVSSAKRNNMRLLAVVMGEPSDRNRADDSERLLNYGFRFFETHQIYTGGQKISDVVVYKGQSKNLKVGVLQNQYITIPSGQYQRLAINTKIPRYLQAPVKKGDKVGELIVSFDGNVISTQPLYALDSVEKGGIFTRTKDAIKLTVKRWIGS